MDRTEEMKRQALLEAWKKISQFVKDNYTGVFAETQEIEWKHEVYYKIAFFVSPKGEAYFARGSHGWAYSPDEYSFKPGCTGGRISYKGIEEIVTDWQTIKGILSRRANRESAIYDFKA